MLATSEVFRHAGRFSLSATIMNDVRNRKQTVSAKTKIRDKKVCLLRQRNKNCGEDCYVVQLCIPTIFRLFPWRFNFKPFVLFVLNRNFLNSIVRFQLWNFQWNPTGSDSIWRCKSWFLKIMIISACAEIFMIDPDCNPAGISLTAIEWLRSSEHLIFQQIAIFFIPRIMHSKSNPKLRWHKEQSSQNNNKKRASG